MSWRRIFMSVCTVLGLIAIGDGVNLGIHAQGFLKDLLTRSPGPLSKPHEEFDSIQNCVTCHQNRLGGEVANQKCLDCHSEIKSRFESQRGYHWNKAQCKDCHGEHKGRPHTIFAPKDWLKSFNHEETGYELQGKHAAVPCLDCHVGFRQNSKTKELTPSPTYLGASTKCYDCHQKVYEHRFSKEQWLNCTDCHSETAEAWKKLRKKMRFNHDETNYPLEGLHQPVKCNSCHLPDPKKKRVTTFAPLKSAECTDCHADPHKGSFGDNCLNCHNVYRQWKDVIPAGTATPATLTPSPDKTKVTPSPKKGGKGKADSVTGKNEADSVTREKVAAGFDHSKTRYPLKGFHQATPCAGCHVTKSTFKMDDSKFDECSDCHGLPHGKQFASQRCESCHVPEKHFLESTFTLERHSKTAFALTGKHQVLDCNRCHATGQFEKVPSEQCSDCHRNPHDQRQIDKTCAFCHVTTSFSWIQFDHNKNTNFRLTGQHLNVACLSCHVNQVFKNMPASNEKPNCQACHDSPHGSAMPSDCQSCHKTEGFRLIENFDHQKIAHWPLEGRHQELSCQKCHADHLLKNYKVPQIRANAKKTDCANCHLDIHNGSFGTNCASCHNNNSFSVEFGDLVHDLGFFKLEGAHDDLACTDCHKQNTSLQGTGTFCAWCHEKNDIHLGKMGNTCGDCHTQLAWTPTKFKHNQTAFRLTGAHRYVDCRSCHVNQIYQGLPNDCHFCHSASKLPSFSASHLSSTIQDCGDCHSSISWKIRRGSLQ